MTRRRGFWPGQSGHSVPPGFLGDDGGERQTGPAGPAEPPVRWRAIHHPLYPDDVEHGVHIDERVDRFDRHHPDDGYGRDETDDGHGFDRYDRYGRYDDIHRFDDYDHGDDLGGFDGRDPTEPLDGALRQGGQRDDAGSVLRAVLLDRDDDRVEPRGPRGPRRNLRLALARRLEAAWPGQSEEGAPPGFPASGELVLHPPAAASTLVRLPVRGEPTGVVGDGLRAGVNAGFDDAGGDGAVGDGAEARDDEPVRSRGGRFGGRRPVAADRPDSAGSSVPGLPSPRSLQKVAMAVYAALADPIVNADPEARERRTLQVRRFGVLAGSAALAVVLIYAIFPVRTYLEQRAATQRARERIDKLSEANAELEQRKEQLRDDDTVEEIARRDYQLVFPGEESYGLLPPPVPPTTTTTAPPG